jgi:ATP-dependent helicase HrpA
MAAEVVETSRLFARYVAEIDPAWIEDVGRHLCHYSYRDPHWDQKRGAVIAFEKVTYQGLPIVEDRIVSYGRVNPAEAREIFIREALVEGKLEKTYPFMIHNEKILQELRDAEERIRRRGVVVDSEALVRFYDARLPQGIFDARSFDRFMKGFWKTDDQGRPSQRGSF